MFNGFTAYVLPQKVCPHFLVFIIADQDLFNVWSGFKFPDGCWFLGVYLYLEIVKVFSADSRLELFCDVVVVREELVPFFFPDGVAFARRFRFVKEVWLMIEGAAVICNDDIGLLSEDEFSLSI